MKRLINLLFVLFIFGILFYTCAPEQSVRRGFEAKPCLDCHKTTLNEFQKKYVHSPMAKRDCEACHLRHGKIAVLTLKEREERKLCYICHKQMALNMDKTANVHTALKQGKCFPAIILTHQIISSFRKRQGVNSALPVTIKRLLCVPNDINRWQTDVLRVIHHTAHNIKIIS